jgi:hypothetical protein
MKSFAEHAATTVTLTRGAETLELRLVAPIVGWEDEMQRVWQRPCDYKAVVGEPRKSIKLEDNDPRVLEWLSCRYYLMVGKVLAEGGELDMAYPVPMPTNQKELRSLADAIRAELAQANIREGDLLKLLKGYNVLQHGDLTVIAQAQAAGNDSPPAVAT